MRRSQETTAQTSGPAEDPKECVLDPQGGTWLRTPGLLPLRPQLPPRGSGRHARVQGRVDRAGAPVRWLKPGAQGPQPPGLPGTPERPSLPTDWRTQRLGSGGHRSPQNPANIPLLPCSWVSCRDGSQAVLLLLTQHPPHDDHPRAPVCTRRPGRSACCLRGHELSGATRPGQGAWCPGFGSRTLGGSARLSVPRGQPGWSHCWHPASL